MQMFPLLLLVVYLVTRMNSTYLPHLLLKKHVTIRNKTLAKLLISQYDPVAGKAKNAKANRKKLLYAGIVFYILFVLLLILYTLMSLIPDIPAESFSFGSRAMFLTGNTLNAKLPTIFAFVLLFAEVAFHFINTSKYAVEKTTAKRLVQVLYYLFAALCIICMLGGLWMAFDTIIGAALWQR